MYRGVFIGAQIKILQKYIPELSLNDVLRYTKSAPINPDAIGSSNSLKSPLDFLWTGLISCPGVLQEFELRPSIVTETSWMTLCSMGGLETWAAGCSTCVTLPRRQPPPPLPLQKWLQMRWRADSSCDPERKRAGVPNIWTGVTKWNRSSCQTFWCASALNLSEDRSIFLMTVVTQVPCQVAQTFTASLL